MVEGQFVQVFFKEYSNSIAKDFNKFLDEDLYVDLIFICNDKKRIKAHQIVLANLSQFLYKILIENQFDSNGKVVYICMPDIHFNVMERIIQFLYTGQIILDALYLKEFHEVMQLLGMPSCSFIHTNQVVSPCLVEMNEEEEVSLGDENIDESSVLAEKARKPLISCQNGKNCTVALAIGKNTTCVEESVIIPTITEVKSLSKTNAAKNIPVISPVTANLLNNEEESIKKIAKNLFVQLKRISQSSRKIRNDKIIYKCCSSNKCISKNEKDLQERFCTRKFLRRRRCCTQQFVDGQTKLNSFA